MITPLQQPAYSGGPGKHLPLQTLERALLDEGRVQDLLGLNTEDEPGVFDELLNLFISETSLQMNALRQQIAQIDLTAFRRTAHRLKGSTRSFGIPCMGDLCDILEHSDDSADPAELGNLVDRLEDMFAKAVRALQQYTTGRS